MGATAGYQALLKSSANTVAEVKKVDLGQELDIYDVTKMKGFNGSNARDYLPGLKKGTLKFDANLDMSDTNGQLAFFNAASSGASFTLHAFTGQTATASIDITGFVKNFSISLDVAAENKVSIEFQPTGDIGYTP